MDERYEKLLVEMSHMPEVQRDFDGLVCRIAGIGKRSPALDRTSVVINAEKALLGFILEDEYIKRKAGVRRFETPEWALRAFRRCEEVVANEQNRGNPEADWYRMQKILGVKAQKYLPGF